MEEPKTPEYEKQRKDSIEEKYVISVPDFLRKYGHFVPGEFHNVIELSYDYIVATAMLKTKHPKAQEMLAIMMEINETHNGEKTQAQLKKKLATCLIESVEKYDPNGTIMAELKSEIQRTCGERLVDYGTVVAFSTDSIFFVPNRANEDKTDDYWDQLFQKMVKPYKANFSRRAEKMVVHAFRCYTLYSGNTKVDINFDFQSGRLTKNTTYTPKEIIVVDS